MDFLDRLKKEWSLITGAPWSFFTALAACAFIIWGCFEWAYRSRIDTLHATVEGKQATIDEQAGKIREYQEQEKAQKPCPSVAPPAPVEPTPKEQPKAHDPTVSPAPTFAQDNRGSSGENYQAENMTISRPPDRVLDMRTKTRLRKELPINATVLVAFNAGPVEVQKYATQILEFLRDSGYPVQKGLNERVASGDTLVGLRVDHEPDGSFTVVVGENDSKVKPKSN
jgi:hypothetical protein